MQVDSQVEGDGLLQDSSSDLSDIPSSPKTHQTQVDATVEQASTPTKDVPATNNPAGKRARQSVGWRIATDAELEALEEKRRNNMMGMDDHQVVTGPRQRKHRRIAEDSDSAEETMLPPPAKALPAQSPPLPVAKVPIKLKIPAKSTLNSPPIDHPVPSQVAKLFEPAKMTTTQIAQTSTAARHPSQSVRNAANIDSNPSSDNLQRQPPPTKKRPSTSSHANGPPPKKARPEPSASQTQRDHPKPPTRVEQHPQPAKLQKPVGGEPPVRSANLPSIRKIGQAETRPNATAKPAQPKPVAVQPKVDMFAAVMQKLGGTPVLPKPAPPQPSQSLKRPQPSVKSNPRPPQKSDQSNKQPSAAGQKPLPSNTDPSLQANVNSTPKDEDVRTASAAKAAAPTTVDVQMSEEHADQKAGLPSIANSVPSVQPDAKQSDPAQSKLKQPSTWLAGLRIGKKAPKPGDAVPDLLMMATRAEQLDSNKEDGEIESAPTQDPSYFHVNTRGMTIERYIEVEAMREAEREEVARETAPENCFDLLAQGIILYDVYQRRKNWAASRNEELRTTRVKGTLKAGSADKPAYLLTEDDFDFKEPVYTLRPGTKGALWLNDIGTTWYDPCLEFKRKRAAQRKAEEAKADQDRYSENQVQQEQANLEADQRMNGPREAYQDVDFPHQTSMPHSSAERPVHNRPYQDRPHQDRPYSQNGPNGSFVPAPSGPYCRWCYNNGRPFSSYLDHARPYCTRAPQCEFCGERSHAPKHCPRNNVGPGAYQTGGVNNTHGIQNGPPHLYDRPINGQQGSWNRSTLPERAPLPERPAVQHHGYDR